MQMFGITPNFRINGIYTALESFWDSEQVFKGESHDFWELVTVLSGQMEVVEDDRCYILDGGMMVCHAPGEFHRIRSAGGTSPRFLVLTFGNSGSLPERLKEGVFTLEGGALEEYLSIFYPLHEFYGESRTALRKGHPLPRAGEREIETVLRLEAFLVSLSRRDLAEGRRSVSAPAKEYRALVRAMTDRVRDNLSLSQLAAICHVSESYVKKLFRTFAGEGAMSYYARLRVGEIKELLKQGESVTSTAERMNFSSGAYLSTFFKKQTGMTPGEYIRKR